MVSTTESPVRALFLDLDGTLLTPAKTISSTTIQAFRACEARGIAVYVATGRAGNVARQLALHPDQARYVSQGVFHNGALIRIGGKEETRGLAPDLVASIVSVAEAHPQANVVLQFHDDRHAFRHELPPGQHAVWGLSGPEECRTYPCAGQHVGGVLKVVCYGRDAWAPTGTDLSALYRDLVATLADRCRIYLSDYNTVIQVMEHSVSKSGGVRNILNRTGLRPEEIVVFGDDVNDREMFEHYPRSVAMGNAIAEIKALARHQTRSNAEEGIAWALEHLLGLV